jgi:transcriptional regulator with XRE-family HTH domain
MSTLEILKANEHKSKTGFLEEAQYVRDNWGWLKYSYAVAVKVKSRMDELGWTQKQLAEALGCTQQHISSLLKGRVNMTLETLSKLEEALQFDLIGKSLSAPTRRYRIPPSTPVYLNDPGPGERTIPVRTSTLVDGYPVRKKKGPKKS